MFDRTDLPPREFFAAFAVLVGIIAGAFIAVAFFNGDPRAAVSEGEVCSGASREVVELVTAMHTDERVVLNEDGDPQWVFAFDGVVYTLTHSQDVPGECGILKGSAMRDPEGGDIVRFQDDNLDGIVDKGPQKVYTTALKFAQQYYNPPRATARRGRAPYGSPA